MKGISLDMLRRKLEKFAQVADENAIVTFTVEGLRFESFSFNLTDATQTYLADEFGFVRTDRDDVMLLPASDFNGGE